MYYCGCCYCGVHKSTDSCCNRATSVLMQRKTTSYLLCKYMNFNQLTFVSNYHGEEQSAPLANLLVVNYGNFPSWLNAAGLPFMSKSKAGICNTGTFPFYKGMCYTNVWWWVTFTAFCVSVWPYKQSKHTYKNTRPNTHWQKDPQLRLGGKAKSIWGSKTSLRFYIKCESTSLVRVCVCAPWMVVRRLD